MFKVSPVAAIWLAWLFVASNVVVTKFATPYAASALYMLVSCVAATVLFLPYLLKTGGHKVLFKKGVWQQCLLMATFGTALPMTIFMLALNYTTPTNAAVLNQFEMVYSLIMAYFLLGEKPTGQAVFRLCAHHFRCRHFAVAYRDVSPIKGRFADFGQFVDVPIKPYFRQKIARRYAACVNCGGARYFCYSGTRAADGCAMGHTGAAVVCYVLGYFVGDLGV